MASIRWQAEQAAKADFPAPRMTLIKANSTTHSNQRVGLKEMKRCLNLKMRSPKV